MREESSRKIEVPERNSLLAEEDIIAGIGVRRGTSLFLGRFTLGEVLSVLGKKSFFREARKRGLWPLAFELDSSAGPLQRLKIFLREKTPENLIVDLKIREGRFTPPGPPIPHFPKRELKALFLEWLTLQNPVEAFTETRGALPGQQHPGLGIGKKVVDVFVYLAKLLRMDCILAFPAYYHNAVLFSRFFHFLRPGKEAEVQAIRRTFGRLPVRQLAWAVHLNCLKCGGAEAAYEWTADVQVFPLARDLRDYFGSKHYREAVKRKLKECRFAMDDDEFERKIRSLD